MNKVRLGIIGTGLIFEQKHLPALQKLTDKYEIKALCVREELKTEKWKKEIPQAQIYADYHDLLKSDEVDAVLIATPIHLNYIAASDAVRAGKNVFLEKPIATKYKDAQALIALANEKGKKVRMLEQFAYLPVMQEIKKYIDSKELGEPVMFDKVTHFMFESKNDGEFGYADTPWRKSPQFPLGSIFDGGAHDMMLFTWFFGLPEMVYSVGTELRQGMGEFDHILTCFNFENNLCGTYSYSTYLCGGGNYFNIRFEKGALHLNGGNLFVEKNDGTKETTFFEDVQLHENMWDALYKDYLDGKDGLIGADIAAESLRVFEGIETSIEGNRSAKI